MRAAGVWALIAVAACSDQAAVEAIRVTERDSAGVRIVENVVDTSAAREGWSIDPEPLLSIGGIDAAESEQLYGVAGGVRLDDGRIVIANRGSSDIRVFSPEGSLDSVFGRDGEGPGEYRSPALAGRGAGDTIVVLDAGLRRVTLLSPDAGAIRSFEVGSASGGFPVALGTFEDGSLAIGGGMAFSSSEGFPSGLVRPGSQHVIIGPDGGVRADFGAIPAAEMWAETDESSFRARAIPFGKITIAAPAAGRLWIGTGESWEVRAYRPDTSLEIISRTDRELEPVTDALHDAWLAERLEDLSDPNEIREMRAELTGVPVPDRAAPYQRISTDRLGNVWIGETHMPHEESTTWTILDPGGRVIGRLTMPPRTNPIDIGDDYILAVSRDELDVEMLTLWRLNRS